ncbi:uncharacterized protein LOC6562916 [Drosophila grimshawi]|uniref:GH11703 n=1 Tax=Drosophila grimshawi TaxID=7222 RepID=B4JD21_DROGR|nr:uncharacterized protein LOC6562916 [Drosophila grimshawi]EDW04265.1 GH11703 [Drosophila grimshawi]
MWPRSPRLRLNEMNLKNGNDGAKKSSPRAPYSKTLLGSQLKKRRTQGGNNKQRLQKKQQQSVENKENMQLIRLPKAVPLTPSSSDASFTTSSSLSSGADSGYSKSESKLLTMPAYLTLKRQHSAAILNFRARKSVSQMDFKEARRTGSYQLARCDSRLGQLGIQDATAVQLCSPRFMLNGAGVVGDQQDLVRIASLRIFNTIMLRSWRRRREEVRHLGEQVEDFKRNFVKNRNQLHVYNTLFAVEKRRNDALNDQLKQSYMDTAQIKLSNNELGILLVQANKEKLKLVEEVASKQQEIDNLQELLQITKKDLFQTHTLKREQLEQLTRIQREFQLAKFDIEDLTGQLLALRVELNQKQESVNEMGENIENLAGQLKLSSTQLMEHKYETEQQLIKLMQHSAELEMDIKKKEEELVTLQNCLAATVGHRIRQCLAHRQAYQHATYNLMHFVAYCMLPGTPPPPPSLPLASIPCAAVKRLRGFFHGVVNNGAKESKESSETKRVAF